MKHKRILVVDDDNLLAEVVSMALEDLGYEVETAGNIKESRGWIAANGIDLVIMDIMLPDGRGDDLAEEVKRVDDKHPQVLLISGNYDLIESAEKSHVDGYLAKPFALHELINKVEQLV